MAGFYPDTVVFGFDSRYFDARAGIEPAMPQRVEYGFGGTFARLRHQPCNADILGAVAVVVGETPDALARSQQAIPSVGCARAAFQPFDHAIVDFDAGIAVPCGEQFLRAMIETGFPVWMIAHGHAAIGLDGVKYALAFRVGRYGGLRADMQDMRPVCRDLVARDEDHAMGIDSVQDGQVIVVAQHEKIIAALGVFAHGVLRRVRPVTVGGVSMQVALQPGHGRVEIGIQNTHGIPRCRRADSSGGGIAQRKP